MNRLLLIEDDESVREGLCELLEANGYNVFCGSNGYEGIKLASEIKPDLIICDIMMPRMNGYSVKEELDKENNTTGIPFIFLTAKADMKDFRTGMLLGADDYIIKPFDSEDLLKAIKIRIDKNKKIENYISQLKDKNPGEKENKLTVDDHIFINSGGTPHFIKVGEIVCITAEGNDSLVHLSDSVHFSLRRSLSAWEKLLPSNTFKRTHRSNIINLNYIENISNWSSGTYLIHLKGMSGSFNISQRQAKELRSTLK